MAQEWIKNWTGKKLGYTEQNGSRLWLYDWTGRKLGYYDSSTGTRPTTGLVGSWARETH